MSSSECAALTQKRVRLWEGGAGEGVGHDTRHITHCARARTLMIEVAGNPTTTTARFLAKHSRENPWNGARDVNEERQRVAAVVNSIGKSVLLQGGSSGIEFNTENQYYCKGRGRSPASWRDCTASLDTQATGHRQSLRNPAPKQITRAKTKQITRARAQNAPDSLCRRAAHHHLQSLPEHARVAAQLGDFVGAARGAVCSRQNVDNSKRLRGGGYLMQNVTLVQCGKRAGTRTAMALA